MDPEPDYEEQLVARYGKTSRELADEAEEGHPDGRWPDRPGYDVTKFVPHHRKQD
jgi:hypothetical protein